MIKDPFTATYDTYTGEHWYTITGPGVHLSIPGEHRGKAVCAALNNAYLLGRLQYLESKFPDVEIPVNTSGPETGSN